LSVGPATLLATFAGSASFTPATATTGFTTVCPAGLDGVACYLGAFSATLEAASSDDVKKSTRRGLAKKVKKVGKLLAKARGTDPKAAKALAKLGPKLDKLIAKVEGLPEKKIAVSLRDALAVLASGARSRVPGAAQ
jgi:hypothetical protein